MEKSNRLVSIIIVTAGNQPLFKSCLDSLKIQTYPYYEIIVVDNSLDGDFNRFLRNAPSSLIIYESPYNLFYAQALNKGITLSKGDFILCLNDDCVLDEGFIKEALRGFSMHERVGMVSGKIMRFDKKTIDSTGLLLSYCRTATERGYGRQDRCQFEHAGYVFGVTGAVAFYQRKMLDEIALESDYFDSDFHIFFEDLDISWRAHLCGWKGYYMPHARAYHLRGGTVRKSTGLNKNYARRYLSDQLHFYLIKNRYLTIIKNESLSGFLLHLPCLLFYEIASWMYILLFSRGVLRKFFTEPVNWKSAWRKRELCKRKYG